MAMGIRGQSRPVRHLGVEVIVLVFISILPPCTLATPSQWVGGVRSSELGTQGKPSYHLDSSWPKNQGLFTGLPFSVGVDQLHSIVYVLQRQGHSPVLLLDADSGKEVGNWTMVMPSPNKLLDTPHGLRLRHDAKSGQVRDVFITDVGNMTGHVLRRFSPDGQLQDIIGVPGRPGTSTQPLLFGNVAELTFPRTHDPLSHSYDLGTHRADDEYDFYVVDGDGGPNNRLLRMTGSEDSFSVQWSSGSKGSHLGELDIPHDVDSDEHGRLWVADRANGRLQAFQASTGKALGQLTCMHAEPYGVRVLPQSSNTALYFAITALQNHSLIIVEAPQQLSHGDLSIVDQCQVLNTIVFAGDASPHLMDVEYKTGNLFVADVTATTVYKLVPSK